MAWRGSFVTVGGGLIGYIDVIQKVYEFTEPNTLTKITWRVTDPPIGGVVTIRVHAQEDGLGDYEDVTILDGETFATADVSMVTGAGIWQEIKAADGDALNLSGEYEMQTGEGISQYFTSLDLVKNDAKIGTVDATRDALLSQIIAGTTAQMQNWMERLIVQQTSTGEKLDGYGEEFIYVNHHPIIEITALTENGAALVLDTDYEHTEDDMLAGRIVRISGDYPVSWSSGKRNVVLTYDSGYVNVPGDLVVAATGLVVVRFNETARSGKGWRSLNTKGVDPNAATTYDKKIWERDTIPVMRHYRRF
jgi:hypothetical protein